MSINYGDKIPNNVNLSEDRTLQRALEHWQPEFLNWWREMGPEGSHGHEVYLRTAVSVHPSGWTHYDHVKMPDYRWGIFLNPPQPDGPSASAITRESRSGRTCRASIAPTCAASSSPRAIPNLRRSNSSGIWG